MAMDACELDWCLHARRYYMLMQSMWFVYIEVILLSACIKLHLIKDQ